MKNVFICVITCRRPMWLARLIDGLLTLELDSNINATVLIVDNAQDAETEKVVAEKAALGKLPVIYDVEPQPGIVFARNRCAQRFLEENGDYLVFIDDDEWPQSPDWLNKLCAATDKYAADIVTSHVISVGEPGTPEWSVSLIYGNNPYKEGQFIDVFYTNNVLISRKVINQLHPCFDARFAMTGASDYHFALRAKQAGYQCVYIDAPVVEEFPKSRATIKWFCRRGYRSGIGYTRSHIFEESFFKALVRCGLLTGVRVLRGLAKLVVGALTANKTKFVDGLFRLCSAAGTIAGFLGVKHEEYKVIHGK